MTFRVLLCSLMLINLASATIAVSPALADEKATYQQARDAYYSLKSSAQKRKYRHNWLKVIDRYEKVCKKYPKGSRCDDSLYMGAKLYMELYPYSKKREDIVSSNKLLKRVVDEYPQSSLADDAAFMMGENYEKLGYEENAYHSYMLILEDFKDGDMVNSAGKRVVALKAGLREKAPSEKEKYSAEKIESEGNGAGRKDRNTNKNSKYVHVTDVRHWSNPNYTRIVIDVDGPVKYKSYLLKKDPSINKPPRLVIDILNAKKMGDPKEKIPIGDGLLKRARVAQNDVDRVRVVLDIESIKDYKIFPMPDPFKIIIDVRGEDTIGAPSIEALLPGIGEDKKGLKAALEDESMSLSTQLGLGIRKIVLDPGHGGKDPGAIGPRGTMEKDVNLSVAKSLKEKLEKNFNYEVVLTRSDDRYLDLAERTAIANIQNADLFVSIHANANRNRKAYGIETYVMNARASDRYAAEVAARENAVTSNSMGEFGSVLEEILVDMQKTNKINESNRLAASMQSNIADYLAKRYDRIKNLGVKKAPFYVLIGANMPSILVEVGFISNKTGEKRLSTPKYVENLGHAMSLGIDRYARLIKRESNI